MINRLKKENSWTKDYFSGFSHPLNGKINSNKKKENKGLEIFFFNNFANRLDLWLMKLTFKQWEKKFKHFDKSKLELTMRTNRGISKHHPQDFQNKVLSGLEERMAKLQA